MLLKSELMSDVLKILLWVLFSLAAIDFAGTIVLAIDVDFYLNHIESINNLVILLSSILYVVIIVIYLIWIYRVHMDLNHYFVNYSRSPGMALACMMIPLFNFYGLPSTFLRIGEYFCLYTSDLEKQGRWIRRMTVSLLILIFITSRINYSIRKADDESLTGLWMASGIAELLTYSIFLYLCITISKGLKNLQAKKNAMDNQMPAEWNVPSPPAPPITS